MNDSLILRPSGDRRVELRESYLDMVDGDRKAAVLLSILDYWTTHEHNRNEIHRRLNRENEEKGQAERYPINDALWVQRTREELVHDSMGELNRNTVTEASNALEEAGYIEKDQPFLDQGDRRMYYRLRIDRINEYMHKLVLAAKEKDRQREKDLAPSPPPETTTPKKTSETKPESDEPKESEEPEWTPDDWEYKRAERVWSILKGLGHLNKDLLAKEEKMLQSWCEVLAWAQRVRGYEKDELDLVLTWLFGSKEWSDNWWVPNGALISLTKFKEKTKQGEWRIHEFHRKARLARDGAPQKAQVSVPAEGEEVPQSERDKIIKAYPETKGSFYAVGQGTDRYWNQTMYRYLPGGVMTRDSINNSSENGSSENGSSQNGSLENTSKDPPNDRKAQESVE